MFCSQCEQTAKGEGCTRVGVCGKELEGATLQDLLIYALKGLSQYAVKGRKVGVKDRDLHSVGEVRVCIRERYSDLSGVSIDLNVLDNIGIGMDDPLAFLSQFNIDAQLLDFLIARKNGARR